VLTWREWHTEIPYAYLDDAVAEALQTWLATVPPTVMAEFTQFLLNEVFSAEKNHKTSGIGLRMLLAAIARGFPDVVRGAVDHASFVQKYLGDSPATYPKHEPNGECSPELALCACGCVSCGVAHDGVCVCRVVTVLSEDTALLRANFVPVLVWYFGQTIEDHPALAFDRTTSLPYGSHTTHGTQTPFMSRLMNHRVVCMSVGHCHHRSH
jgi:hypothetical protein